MKLNSYKPIKTFNVQNSHKKDTIKFAFSIVVCANFLSSYCLYLLALEKCKEGQHKCGQKIHWIYKKLKQAIFSSIIMATLFELMILKLVTKLHLIHVFIFLSNIYIYSHGQEFYDHGFFNFLGFLMINIIIMLLLLPFNIFIYLIENKNKLFVFLYLSFLIFLFFFYIIFININLSCKDWPKGLNNTYIDNNENIYGCLIKIPKYCPYKIGSYFLDISKIDNNKCRGDLSNKENTLEFSNSSNIYRNTTRFGYPLTNKDSMCLHRRTKHKNILLYVKNNLIDMDNKTQLKKAKANIPEIITDFSKNKFGELIINVNYNNTLSNERKKLERNTKPYSDNIMILYFDSVSRCNGLRQLKKTLKFIEKFMSYKGYSNKLFPNENFHSFQFLKYYSFRAHTVGNYPKMFYGRNFGENITRITKYLKKNGYVTAFSNDMCQLDPCYLPHDMSQEEISDHEYIICDANRKDINSMVKRCLYDKVNIGHQIEYGNQFWRKYKENRKFLLIVNNDGHEGTLEVLKYSDEYIYKFLNNLFNENLLKDSTVIIISDHGCPMPSIYYFNDFFQYEHALPMLYILCHDKKNLSYNKQYKHLHRNQQKFITAYDFYNTIGYLIYGESYKEIKNKEKSKKDTPKSKYGKSIFTRIDSKRTPSDYKDMSRNICISIKKK